MPQIHLSTLKRMRVVEGDITQLDVDAVVNAANPELRRGGGVCGAIHRAAGPELEQDCLRLGGCPTGDAKLTKGYRLKANYVVHAVGPVWHGGDRGEDQLLASAYRRSLEVARDHGDIDSIAFPAISTGVYGFPPDRAARIAVRTVAEFLEHNERPKTVIFCCFGSESARLHRAAIADLEESAVE